MAVSPHRRRPVPAQCRGSHHCRANRAPAERGREKQKVHMPANGGQQQTRVGAKGNPVPGETGRGRGNRPRPVARPVHRSLGGTHRIWGQPDSVIGQ